jgi:copper chaperone
MEVLVFKTNLRYKKQVSALTAHISNVPGIVRWNVDLDDVDKILRIEASAGCSARQIEDTMGEAGYYCEELL